VEALRYATLGDVKMISRTTAKRFAAHADAVFELLRWW
jgi:hypothetical protein